MPGKDAAYIAQHAFEQIAPDFVSRFKPGDIIVAGRNFGINSSREQAIQVMRLLGVAAVVSPAFGRQFFRNAINSGLPGRRVRHRAASRKATTLELDLRGGSVSVPARGVSSARFPPLPRAMQSLLAAGGLIPFLQAHPDWKLA